MSCSLNSKGKSGPGAPVRDPVRVWGPPEAGEKNTPEMLKNSILA